MTYGQSDSILLERAKYKEGFEIGLSGNSFKETSKNEGPGSSDLGIFIGFNYTLLPRIKNLEIITGIRYELMSNHPNPSETLKINSQHLYFPIELKYVIVKDEIASIFFIAGTALDINLADNHGPFLESEKLTIRWRFGLGASFDFSEKYKGGLILKRTIGTNAYRARLSSPGGARYYRTFAYRSMELSFFLNKKKYR